MSDVRLLTVLLISLVLALPLFAVSDAASHAAPGVWVGISDDNANAMDPEGDTPVEALDPRGADWRVWVGPLVLGIFGFLIVLVIRRFSWGAKDRPRREQGKKERDDS